MTSTQASQNAGLANQDNFSFTAFSLNSSHVERPQKPCFLFKPPSPPPPPQYACILRYKMYLLWPASVFSRRYSMCSQLYLADMLPEAKTEAISLRIARQRALDHPHIHEHIREGPRGGSWGANGL